MKRLIPIVGAVMMMATTANAAKITSLGFRAYTSATSVDCGIFGTNQIMPKDYNGVVIQNVSPDPSLSRTAVLGTKGFYNYSTLNVTNVTFTCRKTGTSEPISVKVFMNAVETHFLTLDSGTITIGR